MKLKILSWNVRRPNDEEQRKPIKFVIRTQKVDLVCLYSWLEAQVLEDFWITKVVETKVAPGGILPFQGNKGLQLLEMKCRVFSISYRFRIFKDNFVWLFTKVYGPILRKEEKEVFGNVMVRKAEARSQTGFWDSKERVSLSN